jgi:acetyl-CoA carboxylase carboxyltransferase component
VVSASWDAAGERPAVVVRIDPGHHRGALTHEDGQKLAAAARTALANRQPFLGILATSGADVHDGVAALHGWGTAARALAACSGVVPVALAVTGPTVSGPALLLGLADLVALTGEAQAYVSGPAMVRDFTGVQLDAAALGGAGVHARSTGVATFLAGTEEEAVALLRHALALLPDHAGQEPPVLATADPADRPTPELRTALPASPEGSYDVRRILTAVVDEGELLELRAAWAPNLVTALATVAGHPVGLVANQPQAIAGTLDIPASQKGARFVAFCDAFNLPIVTFVDTPGFFPGKDLEWRGMIRYGAQLAFAYAEATVPRVCVITRKAYGGAYIVMDSKTMGNDLCLAWPSGEVAVMGAKGAVSVLHRKADAETQARLEEEYEREYLAPYVAAERGYVDAVIDPADTRSLVARSLDVLRTKRVRVARRAHANGPL